MQKQHEPSSEHRIGDKVRVRSGDYKGQRGAILTVTQQQLEVQLEGGNKIYIASQELTNYSLAARKAWQTMRTQ